MKLNGWPPARIGIPILLLVFSLGISSIVWWVDADTVSTQLQEDFQLRVRDRIRDLGANIEYAMAHGDQENVRKLVFRLGLSPSLDYALLIGKDGHVLAATRNAMMSGKDIPDKALQMSHQVMKQDVPDVHVSKSGRIIWADVSLRWNPQSQASDVKGDGVLVARYNLRFPKTMAMAAVKRGVAWVAVAMVLFVIVLAVLMHIAWGRRIKRIILATKLFANGDLEARAGITSNDEVGEIGKAFDTMADALEKQNSRLMLMSHVIDQLAESVMISDVNGVIQYVNPHFTILTGYTAEEVIGQKPDMLKSGVHQPDFYHQFWEQISSGKVWRGNMTERHKDGTIYTTRMTASPVFNGNREITNYVSIQADITRQIEMEEEIRHMQKMESLGTLVGGIAHEFNNMLAGIKGNLYLAGKRAKEIPQIANRLEAADRLSSRAADMVQQMLTFARKDMVRKNPLNLPKLIGEAMQMIRISVPENIELVLDLGREDLIIHGDTTQLQQIMLNLLANARDALEGVEHHGEIRVSLERRKPESVALAAEQGLDSNMEYAVLTIADNGRGISLDARDKIFEPFYTTKEVGKGTGLGLAMVFGAVHGHGGAIEVESELGQGTAFRLWFPLDRLDDNMDESSRFEVVHGRGETILIADDDGEVLDSLGEVLDSIGYHSIHARDGDEAVTMFAQASDRISAVLLDVVMPGMNGADAAKQMRAIRPDLPVVFTTGYDKNSVLHHYQNVDNCRLVAKPASPIELSHTLRELLDEFES